MRGIVKRVRAIQRSVGESRNVPMESHCALWARMRTWENFGQPPQLFPPDLELFPPGLPDGEDMLGF